MQNLFSKSFQTFDKVAGLLNDAYPGVGTTIDVRQNKDFVEAFWRKLPPDSTLSKLVGQNGQLISELAEASAVLESMSALAIQIHALFAARPQHPVELADISSLPDEMLTRIFEEAVPHSKGFTATSKKLSHVCRRWRLLALDFPSLWAEANFDPRLDECITLLERSKNAPLRIHILALDDIAIENFLDIIIPHSKRWSRLEVDVYDQEDCEGFIDLLDSPHAALDLPLLKDLEICYREEGLEGAHEGNPTVLLSKWNMPNLRSLDMAGFLSPHQIPLDATFGTNLTRCSFHFETEIELYGTMLGTCSDFLQHHSSLEELRLSLSEVYDEVSGSSFTPVTLPNLRTLLISLSPFITESIPGESFNSITLFMETLDMPCLSKVVISLDDCRPDTLNEWIKVFLPKLSYPNLVDFSVQALPHDHNSGACVERLLKCAPNLRNFTIFTPTIPMTFTGREPNLFDLPNLRKVALMPCNSKHSGRIPINKLLNLTGQQGGSRRKDFEGLEIVQHAIGQSLPTTRETLSIDNLTISSSYPDLMSRF